MTGARAYRIHIYIYIYIYICRAGRPPVYFSEREALSILYAYLPNLTGVSGWLPSYHEAFLVRLLSLALMIGVLWPAIWLLLTTICRLVRRCIKTAAAPGHDKGTCHAARKRTVGILRG